MNRNRRDHLPGLRLGRFIFVPQLSTAGTDDPWAHRKGEPRIFLLFWVGYLLLSVMITLFALRPIGAPTPIQSGFAARSLTIMIAIGVAVLWPTTRLSQRSPRRPISSVILDITVILPPATVLLITLPLLTLWPPLKALQATLLVASWAILVAPVLALGLMSTPPTSPSAHGGPARTSAMAVILAMVLAAPILAIAAPAIRLTAPPELLLFSPITAPWVLDTEPTLKPLLWLAIAAPAGLGLLLWIPTILFAPRPPHPSPTNRP